MGIAGLDCADFIKRKWQRAFKHFLKGKLQLWKSHYLGHFSPDSIHPACAKTQGADDQWDDKMNSPTAAPATTRRRLADTVTIDMNIQAIGTPLSAITSGLNNVKTNGIQLSGYPKYNATVEIVSSSTTSDAAGASGPSLCFGASETVTLENGESKKISDVQTGDRILAANTAGGLVYSDVVFVPHAKNDIEAEFTQIITESGRDIKMTGLHMIPAGSCTDGNTLPLVYASTVAADSCVSTISGLEKVVEVKKSMEKGVYTVVVMDEMIVVNGIIASPFGVSHTFTNIYYNLHRFAYTTFPEFGGLKAIREINEFVGKTIFALFSA